MIMACGSSQGHRRIQPDRHGTFSLSWGFFFAVGLGPQFFSQNANTVKPSIEPNLVRGQLKTEYVDISRRYLFTAVIVFKKKEKKKSHNRLSYI